MLEKTWGLMDKAQDLIDAKLNDGVLDRIAERALKSANDSFGKALESLESTPDPSPSQN